ncbi:HalOD1 output domain-containing protein [Natrialbaceae archaeon A-CW3]
MNTTATTTISTVSSDNPDEVIESVVTAVADAAGVSPLHLPPLLKVIDPDALDRIVRTGSQDLTVEFTYNSYRVRVSGDGYVTVRSLDDGQ